MKARWEQAQAPEVRLLCLCLDFVVLASASISTSCVPSSGCTTVRSRVWQDSVPSSRGSQGQGQAAGPWQTAAQQKPRPDQQHLAPGADGNDSAWHGVCGCLVIKISWLEKLELICKSKQY